MTDAGEGWSRVRMTWRLERALPQNELAVIFKAAREPDFWWAPHLAPYPGDCIAQHVFRSPALIVMTGRRTQSSGSVMSASSPCGDASRDLAAFG